MPRLLVAAVLLPAFPAGSFAQPPKAEAEDQRLQQMRQRFRSLELRATDEDGDAVEVERLEQPLLRFNDPARESSDGTLWAWGKAGRPLVLVALEQYADRRAQALVSLRTKQSPGVAVTTKAGWKWSPEEPGLEFQPFPGAPEPAGTRPRRLLQMKRLARRFALTEFWEGEKYELRLLPQPVHRYARPEKGLADGALFVYAHGTNPEALLLLECRPEDASPWICAFAPVADARLVARLEDDEVWTSPLRRYPPNAQQPYAPFREPRDSD